MHDWDFFLNICVTGLTTGFLYALIALGYTMVYGIVELINFAHGDLFMLGCFLAWTIVGALAAASAGIPPAILIAALLVVVPVFCAGVNWSVDRLVYRPQRSAPKLNLLVSAIGVSFVFMNVGQIWGGSQDLDFPRLVPDDNLLGDDSALRVSATDALVIGVTVPVMIALTLFVRYTPLGKAMRATAQNPTAAALMGINVDRVISTTFLIGGALAGVASVVYALKIKTIGWQMGFQNGLYAFTAAVLGGIGNIPGAVLGGLIIGMVYSLCSGYIDARWASALVFFILIVILVFRPAGLLGARTREKV
jgi:branched-chain amino acid transport system permease protein